VARGVITELRRVMSGNQKLATSPDHSDYLCFGEYCTSDSVPCVQRLTSEHKPTWTNGPTLSVDCLSTASILTVIACSAVGNSLNPIIFGWVHFVSASETKWGYSAFSEAEKSIKQVRGAPNYFGSVLILFSEHTCTQNDKTPTPHTHTHAHKRTPTHTHTHIHRHTHKRTHTHVESENVKVKNVKVNPNTRTRTHTHTYIHARRGDDGAGAKQT
jgi:hypothetical protein